MLSLLIATFIATNPTTAIDADRSGLTVRTGETWVFQLDRGQPVNSRRVEESYVPGGGELKITVAPQMGTVMMITNGTKTFYNYRAWIVRDENDKGERTSVCTLMSNGRHAIENWPYPIKAIRISDFSRSEDNQMVCR